MVCNEYYPYCIETFASKYRNISYKIVGSAVTGVVDHFQTRALVHVIDIQNKENGPQNLSLRHSFVYSTFGRFFT